MSEVRKRRPRGEGAGDFTGERQRRGRVVLLRVPILLDHRRGHHVFVIIAGDLDPLLGHERVAAAPVALAAVAAGGRVNTLFRRVVLRLVPSQEGDTAVAARVLATNDHVLAPHLAAHHLDPRHLQLSDHLLANGRALRARDEARHDPVLGLQDDPAARHHVPLQQLVPLVHHERLALVARHEPPVPHHRRRPRRRAPRRRETVLLLLLLLLLRLLLLLLLLLSAVPTELLVRRWKLVPVRGQPLTASAVVHPTIYRL